MSLERAGHFNMVNAWSTLRVVTCLPCGPWGWLCGPQRWQWAWLRSHTWAELCTLLHSVVPTPDPSRAAPSRGRQLTFESLAVPSPRSRDTSGVHTFTDSCSVLALCLGLASSLLSISGFTLLSWELRAPLCWHPPGCPGSGCSMCVLLFLSTR
jgi:hypothetical protein